MCLTAYYSMIRSKDQSFELRRSVVESALQVGVKKTARAFRTTPKTVRKWRDRYKAEGVPGLRERSRRPHRCPHKTTAADEARILEQRKKTPGFGAMRLKKEFGLKPGVHAIGRVLKQHGQIRKPRKKHEKKRDLRAVKQKFAPFTFFKIDVKHLCDIARSWPYMIALGLPMFQYTIVEVRVGAIFLEFAREMGVLQSCAFIVRFLMHLAKHGIALANVLIQNDGGGEFEGTQVIKDPDGFSRTIEGFGARNHAVPGCPNAQAECESLHSRIEPEFFDIESFRGGYDFWQKIGSWQNWRNLVRKNSGRGWRSPAENLSIIQPGIDPHIFLLPPADIDTLAQHQGDTMCPRSPPLDA